MNNVVSVPTDTSSLKEWLYYIEHLCCSSIDLTLHRIRKIAVSLDLIKPGKYVVLIGGTNGKGTTCCLLEAILLNSNVNVGLYISPHLLSYNERIRVRGKELSDAVHIQAMSHIENVRHHLKLTYFEFITLSALYIFKREKLDVIILEVGLGGRLDATNIVDADITAITNVAIDHTEFLGIHRNMIAQEKSGIFRANKPAVIGEINRPVIIDKIAEYRGAILFACGRDWNYHTYLNTWFWQSYNNDRSFFSLPLPLIPIENAAVVLGILYWLPFSIPRTAIDYGLQHATLPGRLQIVQHNPLVILDVGHNPHAADYLVRRLSSIFSKMGTIRVVLGMLQTKDICGTIDCLNNVVNVWYLTTLNVSSSVSVKKLSDCIIQIGRFSDNIKEFSNVLDAYNQAMLDAAENDCIIVFGSFYAVGPVLREIMHRKN